MSSFESHLVLSHFNRNPVDSDRKQNLCNISVPVLFHCLLCSVFTAVFWVIHLTCHLIQPTLEPLKSLHVATQSPCLPPRCSTGSHMLTPLKFWYDLELVFGHLLEVYFSKTVYILSMLPLLSWSGLWGGGGVGPCPK